jgi:hypothetical protein
MPGAVPTRSRRVITFAISTVRWTSGSSRWRPYGNQSEPLSYDLTEIRSLPAGWMEKRMKIEIVHCPT